MPYDPIPDRWDIDTDVVVVGAGNSGLPAAIEAHDKGVKVLLLENNKYMGGLMRASGGFMFFCDTHVQKKLGVEDHIEWGIEDELVMSDFRAVPELVRTYVANGAETCSWLERLGLTWADKLTNGDWGAGARRDRHVLRTHFAGVSSNGFYPGGFPDGQNGFALTTVLEKTVKNLGIDVRFEHRMRRIFREPNGPVVGIEVETPGGRINVRARKAVILASGGATTNEQLVKAWDPRLVNDAMYSDGLPYMEAMGDAFIAGEDVGAGLSDMSFVAFLPVKFGSIYYSLSQTEVEEGIKVQPTGVLMTAKNEGYQRVILVKNDGTRYINEAEATHKNPDIPRDVNSVPPAEYPEEPFMRKFLALPNPKNVWAVLDDDQVEAMGWPKDQLNDPQPLRGRGLDPKSVAVANTLEELADKMGVDKANFMETTRRYNRFVDSGVDEDFGKPQPLFAIQKPPYVGVKMNVIRHTPAGGIRINTKAQVLDRWAQWDGRKAVGIDEEAVIPHLYAVGEASAFVGFRRAHRKTGPILTMGRIAGLAAADEQSI